MKHSLPDTHLVGFLCTIMRHILLSISFTLFVLGASAQSFFQEITAEAGVSQPGFNVGAAVGGF